MFRFVDANNIVVTGTIIHCTPKPAGQEVDGYEIEVSSLLTKLRRTWTGWALIKDLWPIRTSRQISPTWIRSDVALRQTHSVVIN